MHAEARAFVEQAAHRLGPRQFVVEFGSRNVNGSVRGLFPTRYVGIDMAPGPGVDAIADAALWQPETPPDTVVCCEVLEHAPNARAIVDNALAMLAPNGALILTCATTGRTPHSALTGGPLLQGEYYQNLTRTQFDGWLNEASRELLVRDVSVNTTAHDLYAVIVVK